MAGSPADIVLAVYKGVADDLLDAVESNRHLGDGYVSLFMDWLAGEVARRQQETPLEITVIPGTASPRAPMAEPFRCEWCADTRPHTHASLPDGL